MTVCLAPVRPLPYILRPLIDLEKEIRLATRRPKVRGLMKLLENRDQPQIYHCFVCGGPGTTKHHLVPQQFRDRVPHQASTVRACGACHGQIHRLFTNKELAVIYYRPDLLLKELQRRRLR